MNFKEDDEIDEKPKLQTSFGNQIKFQPVKTRIRQLESDNKVDKIYIIRRGGAKVTKNIKFIKNDRKFRKERTKKLTSKQFTDFDDLNNREQIENDKMIELLSVGPSEEDIIKGIKI